MLPDSEATFLQSIPKRQNSIFILDEQVELAEELRDTLKEYKFDAIIFEDLVTLAEATLEKSPLAVIMDINFFENSDIEIATGIQQISESPLPIIFTSMTTALDTRLKAVRAGGYAYFTKPIDIKALLEKLEEINNHENYDTYQIIIIEDEAPLPNTML